MLVSPVVQVQYNPDVTGPRHLIAAVEDAGFDAEAISIDRCGNCWVPQSQLFTPLTETSWLRQSLVLAHHRGFPQMPPLMAQPL